MKKTSLSAIFALLLLVNLFITSCSRCEHEWVAPTCSKRRHCSICGIERGELLDHISGEGTLVKESTLLEEGVEEVRCAVCGKNCGSRTVDKKKPEVGYKTFNFYDDEFIAWVNSMGFAKIENEEVELGNSITKYLVELPNGNRALITFFHHLFDKDSTIERIIIAAPTKNDAINLIVKIGSAISPEFSGEDATNALLVGDEYSLEEMYACDYPYSPDPDMEAYALAPKGVSWDIIINE